MIKVKDLLLDKCDIEVRPIIKSILGESLSFSDYNTEDLPADVKPVYSLRSLHEDPDVAYFNNEEYSYNDRYMICTFSIMDIDEYGKIIYAVYTKVPGNRLDKVYCNNKELLQRIEKSAYIEDNEFTRINILYPDTHEGFLYGAQKIGIDIDASYRDDMLESGAVLGRIWKGDENKILCSFWSSHRNTLEEKSNLNKIFSELNLDTKKMFFEFPDENGDYNEWFDYSQTFGTDKEKLKDTSSEIKKKLAQLIHLSPDVKKALLSNKVKLQTLANKLGMDAHKLSYILNYNLAESKLIKEGGKLFGAAAQRVSTEEMNKVFAEVKPKMEKYFDKMQLSKHLPSKTDHGDVDIVFVSKPIRQTAEQSLKSGLGSNIKRLSTNDNIKSVLYHSDVINKDVHIDFILAKSSEEYDAQYEYLSYNDFSGILRVLARQLGFSYSSEGFFKVYVDKKGRHHKLLISRNLRDGLRIMGYDKVLNTFDNIQNPDDIITFIGSSPLFDSSYYVGQTMNHSDRKRVRAGRPTADYVRQGLINLNKKAEISDSDYFLKKLYPNKVKELENQEKEIESKTYPQSKYSGDWLMRNFDLQPGPILGKIKTHLHSIYGDDLETTPENTIRDSILKFLSLKENYYLEESYENKDIESKYFKILFNQPGVTQGAGKIFFGDKYFGNALYMPKGWGKYGEKWVVNRDKVAIDMGYSDATPFGSLEDMLKFLDNWYEKQTLKEQMFPKEFDRHSLGSCMVAAELATKYFLKKGIKDFKIIEGWVSLDPNQEEFEWSSHTWIEFSNGRIFDPTKKQWEKWGFDLDNIEFKEKVKTYTPEEYLDLCEWEPGDWKKFKKQKINEGIVDISLNVFQKKYLTEIKSPYIIVGFVDDDLKIVAKSNIESHDELMKLYPSWVSKQKIYWRFNANTFTIYWYEDVVDEDIKEEVKNYIEAKFSPHKVWRNNFTKTIGSIEKAHGLREKYEGNIKWVIGYVDSYGKVHHYVDREESSSKNNKKDTVQHSSIWPTAHHKKWRWNPHVPKHLTADDDIDEEEIDKIWQIIDKYL